MAEHSPLPWSVVESPSDGGHEIRDADGEFVTIWNGSDTCAPTLPDMRFIVHRVNTYDALLAALKAITPDIPQAGAMCHVGICTQAECAHCQRIIAAHHAIRLAEGREAVTK